MIDFIGDIHGYANKLEELLIKLGYTKKNGSYAHPERTAFFIGDYIDRGDQIKETVNLVRNMVENGNAIALMGNHEYNAICYFTKEIEGNYLRQHSSYNTKQLRQTLDQFADFKKEYEEAIRWFKTLPLFYEADNFRAVHACWDNDTINYLKPLLQKGKLNDELLIASSVKGSLLNKAIDITLKGNELFIHGGFNFIDKDGKKRNVIRTRWWEDPSLSTYHNYSIEEYDSLPDIPIDLSKIKNIFYYSAEEKPVFFGHYWRKGIPELFRNNVCCLDYSVAKAGFLTAYRFDGETKLSNDKFVFV